jgi:hypothetical protein
MECGVTVSINKARMHRGTPGIQDTSRTKQRRYLSVGSNSDDGVSRNRHGTRWIDRPVCVQGKNIGIPNQNIASAGLDSGFTPFFW